MKAIKLSDWQDSRKPKKEEERWVVVKPCLICGAVKEGYYARFGDSGVCSKTCMIEQDKLPKYPDHPERSDDDTTNST